MTKKVPLDLQEAYEEVMSLFMNRVPVTEMNFGKVVVHDLMGYGSTKEELIRNIREYQRFIQVQEDQSKGLEMNFKRDPIYNYLSEDKTSAIIVEEITIRIDSNDSVSEFTIRLSIAMDKKAGQWKMVHFHGSVPVETEKEDTWHLKEWEKEKEKLQILVDEQTADLQTKNRELELEAALENVRSRSLAMHKSDELNDVVKVIFEKMTELDVPSTAISIQTFTGSSKDMQCFVCGDVGTGIVISQYLLPYFDHPIFKDYHNVLENDLDFYKGTYSKEEKDSFYDVVLKRPELKDLPAEVHTMIRESSQYVLSMAPAEKSVMSVNDFDGNPLSESQINIIKRFAKVFDQTYTRFLDLKKVEEQAREAKIEAALEKVRSRSLAMHDTSELQDVIKTVHEQFNELKVEISGGAFIVINQALMDGFYCWGVSGVGDYVSEVKIPFIDRPIYNVLANGIKEGKEFFTEFYSREEKEEFFKHLYQHEPFSNAPESHQKDLLAKEGGYARSCVVYDHISIFIINHDGKRFYAEENEILKRMGRVFEQAYTRFRDLLKAEESARQSRQQASLDRVRADISSMRSADDLGRITPLIWNELTTLGIPFIRCGIFIIHENEQQVEVYLSKPDGTSLAVMHLPFDANDLTANAVKAWRQKNVYQQHWTKEEFLKWGRSMVETGQIGNLKSYQGAEEAPESLDLHFVPFNQGMLYVGSTSPLDEEEISLSESLAKAFSIAYSRYEDFIKLEKAKTGIENALAELKATQTQLIQQEKLASLGQLTAGIAHEIKNPLNFVNNFSELSVELVEEAREEVRRGTEDREPGSGKDNSPFPEGMPAAKKGDKGGCSSPEKEEMSDEPTAETTNTNLILEILDDIEANLKTIHKHGSRADSIVKSMLQHSRGGDGKMEPTPLNPLIKEYVNLAFHGMRAGKDLINVDIDLHLDENVGEVPLIAEDFSRVILNLTNNAFDAMRTKLTDDGGPKTVKNSPLAPASRHLGEGSGAAERSRGVFSVEDYIPKLTVRTKSNADSTVSIKIEDNGPGIPEEIKDNILQPFFTTKKGTQGTGLGLSITNDIIKAHGGSMEIHSQPGKTIFTIRLNG